MWRYLVGAAGTLLLAVAAMFLFRGSAASAPKALLPGAPAAVAGQADAELPDAAPRASDRTREQKRFDRIDKDKNDSVTSEEYFTSRHKAFARLDLDHDGKLSFEEWAAKGLQRFAAADKDKSGALTRAEFATTALKRKPGTAPRCACAAAKPAPAASPAAEDGEE